MRAFALTALLLTSFASRARADTLADFEAARVAYEDQRYDEAATRLERIVLEPATSAVASAIVLESRKYLAASYLFLGRQPEAQDQFVLLLRQDPSYELDPVRFPRDVLLTFDAARRQVEQERREDAARREAERRAAEEARRQRELEFQRSQRPPTQIIVDEHSRAVALLPYGAGQFQNGHRGLGLFFALSESAATISAVTTFLIHFRNGFYPRSQRPPGFAQREDRANLANRLSVGTFAALALAGILDAQIRFVPETRTEVPTTPVTPPPQASFGIGPGNLTFRLDF